MDEWAGRGAPPTFKTHILIQDISGTQGRARKPFWGEGLWTVEPSHPLPAAVCVDLWFSARKILILAPPPPPAGDTLVVTSWGGATVSSGQRTGLLLNMPPCTGQPATESSQPQWCCSWEPCCRRKTQGWGPRLGPCPSCTLPFAEPQTPYL